MKKVFLIAVFAGGLGFTSMASEKYKLDDASVEQLFVQSSDISFTADQNNDLTNSIISLANSNSSATSGGQTKGGYYLRLIFCGWIGMHRSYMGTGGRALWYLYLCVPVWSSINIFVDFWWPIFSSSAFNKYKGNKKFTVWLGK